MSAEQHDTPQAMDSWWDQAYASGEYLEHWDYRFPSQELVSLVASGAISPGSRVLDIGCGAGREIVFLARCGYEAVGVDLSAEALKIGAERAHQAGVSVDFRLGSALQLPLEDASIDFANDRGCFHHIADMLRMQYAEEVARVLRPGGRLMLRGCREEGDESFVLVTEAVIDQYFRPEVFSRGPVLPIELISDAGSLKANVVVLTRR
ncbi:class I SAM-dependent methyltransferase [bacterium]|nr:class I SAM-dependent methyltransferase [bacterium]